ncbi:MAG TPA: hypothetical protein VEQ11_19005 [Chloroflexota bacterium]|nr:hypothetical protein [Chloroflexota bacterium]
MSKLIIIGIALIIVMLAIWVLWGEVIAARVLRERRLDDEGLRER